MSEQSPDFGSYDGAQGDPPLTHGDPPIEPLKIPELNLPSFSLGGDISSRPDVKLTLKVNAAKTKAEAEAVQIKRATDIQSLPAITKDIQDNQTYQDTLHKEIAQFNAKLNQPLPIHKAIGLDMPDEIAAGVAGLFGGRMDNVIGAAQQNATARHENDFQNQMTKYGVTREDNLRAVASLERELENARSHGERLDQARVGELGHQDDTAHTDVEKAKDRFQKATNPGDAQAAADDLKSLGHPVSPGALAETKKSAGLKYQNEGRLMLATEVQQYEQPGLSDSQADALQKAADAISDQYGIPRHIVRGSVPWKAQLEHDKNAYLKEVQAQKEKDFQSSLKLKGKEAASLIALHAAETEYWKKRPDISAADRQARLEAASMRDSHTADTNARRAQVKIDRLGAQLKEVQTQIQGERDSRKKRTLFSKQASLQQEIEGAKAELSDWSKVRDNIGSEGSEMDKSGGAGALTAPGSKVVYNQGGVTITKH